MRLLGLGLSLALAFSSALAGGLSLDLSTALAPSTGDVSTFTGKCNVELGLLSLAAALEYEKIGFTWLLSGVAWDAEAFGVAWQGLVGLVTETLLYSQTTGWIFFGGARYSLTHVAADPNLDGVFDHGLLLQVTGFLPGAVRFDSLTIFGVDELTVSFTQPGVQGEYEFELRPEPGLPYFPYFTGQKFLFTGVISGGIKAEAETSIVRTGFSHQRFSLTFRLGFLSLELSSVFELKSHVITLTPSLNLDCGWLRIYTEATTQTPSFIGGFTIYGVRIRTMVGNVLLEAMVSFDEVNHDLVLDPYMTRLSVEIGQATACHRQAMFRTDVYFEDGLDWGRVDLCLHGPLVQNTEVWTKIGIGTTGVSNWGLGVRLSW